LGFLPVQAARCRSCPGQLIKPVYSSMNTTAVARGNRFVRVSVARAATMIRSNPAETAAFLTNQSF
jgi:hypothetical protein